MTTTFRTARPTASRAMGLPGAVLATLLAAFGFGALATASTPEPAAQLPATAAAAEAVQDRSDPAAHDGMRCSSCGTVESVRFMPGVDGLPDSFQFRIRLRDGTAHDSTEAQAGNWKAGDRVLLLGGR
jgi:hypothetical protein